MQVQDNAGGIPDTIIGQTFDPYFTTKEYGNGSGIGLVKKHHRGTFWRLSHHIKRGRGSSAYY